MLNIIMKEMQIKNISLGLPWWRSGWESACQCGGRGFDPWSGTIPHAAERLDPWATAAEPARLEPVLRNGRGCDGERPAHRDGEWPPIAVTGVQTCALPIFQLYKSQHYLIAISKLFYLFIYLFLAVLGLRFCARAFSSCGKRGPLFIAVRGPLTIAASPVAEHRLQTRRLSNCGSRA